MRACAFVLAASAALLAAASAPVAAPARVASLNLCTDELLLLLARPDQILSVTHLSHRAAETALWRRAQRYPRNDGSLLGVAPLRPDLVLTMGGGGDRARIAPRLGVRLLDLPFPTNLDDVQASINRVARALGRPHQGEALSRRMTQLRRTTPAATIDAVWLGGGGRSVAATGLAAQWMRLAGLRQRGLPDDRLTLETLLTRPPRLLLRSDYRSRQYSAERSWLAHPVLRRRHAAPSVATDGRRWTCMGATLIDEIARLRGELRQ